MSVAKQNREFLYTQQDFDYLRELSNSRTGIVVSDDKFDMFYSRLSRRLRVLGLKKFSDYLQHLKKDPEEEKNLINAITTNLTAFFRENHHFEYLKTTAVAECLKSSKNHLDVWSAGCSTGEEPYSLAMTLEDLSVKQHFTYTLSASDIDSEVLTKASQGVYDLSRVEGLSKPLLKRWFHKGVGSNKGKVKVKDNLRQKIRFFQLNLMGKLPADSKDIIFCRNVLIYFDHETKATLAEKFANALKPGGYLIIGHSESLYKVSERFESIGNTIYRKIK